MLDGLFIKLLIIVRMIWDKVENGFIVKIIGEYRGVFKRLINDSNKES